MMNDEKLDQYYATRWAARDEFKPYTSPAKSRRLSWIAQCIDEYGPNLASAKSVRVLDYGCGSGWLLPFLRFYGFDQIAAYDVTPQVLHEVAQKYPWAEVIPGTSGFPSPLPDANFDLITSIEVLEHVPHSYQRDYFADLYRITSPGGMVIMTTPNILWRSSLTSEKEQPVEDWVSPLTLKHLAEANGFRILDLGTRGIDQYLSSRGKGLFLNKRLKNALSRFHLWKKYRSMLERFGRGITIYALLQKSR